MLVGTVDKVGLVGEYTRSGACRYWSYEFEVNEVYNLDQLDGCSGPDAPIDPVALLE